MRITNSLMSQSFLANLNKNSSKVFKYQEQLSSLEQVSRPSDDPLKVSKIIDLKNEIKQNAQYKTTINDAIDFTNVQDSALANATNSLQRIHTLTQQAANGTYNTQDRQAIKTEIQNEVETMMDSLNTNFGGRYVFAGQNSTTKPFENNGSGIEYKGSSIANNNLSKEIARGVNVELKTDGSELFELKDGSGNIGELFDDVFMALDNDDTDELGNLLGRIESHIDTTVNTRTEIGAIQNRLSAALDRNDSEYLNLETSLSKNQDIDLAETYMNYTMEMNAYQASMNMGTKILQTNIMDYVR
ncbi:flagellar hook-associated protein 3 FlgL [Alkalibacterium putridalgicola]|uniref:Flagellar hook-associated protein 3 FlgL n=1 Tax=Alkalibacterium putridalgicola TaxID=426703 RepID=A0A1H7RGD2_9LACT|nr:flagellar hook-associated protein FlgL [Alkalibacterium putridalgicola]GEK88797.1 flagellar hook-associated protein FlgL [Alkalibacterium putridalgicola]SEL58397.1 flagellar hook-associated protein 3 FlgL [Alkalibacterium putridalgicola]